MANKNFCLYHEKKKRKRTGKLKQRFQFFPNFLLNLCRQSLGMALKTAQKSHLALLIFHASYQYVLLKIKTIGRCFFFNVFSNTGTLGCFSSVAADPTKTATCVGARDERTLPSQSEPTTAIHFEPSTPPPSPFFQRLARHEFTEMNLHLQIRRSGEIPGEKGETFPRVERGRRRRIAVIILAPV